MALKNSKTGSLPVSEIYSFMKEHFPYFKVRSLCKRMPANKPTHHGIKCYLQYTVLSITAILRQHLMDGKILYATTCPWTSASRRWRTRWAVPPERAVFGHSILQRSIKWRKRCRNGNAKISQPSVAAWPIQVSYRWLLSSFIDIFALYSSITAVHFLTFKAG